MQSITSIITTLYLRSILCMGGLFFGHAWRGLMCALEHGASRLGCGNNYGYNFNFALGTTWVNILILLLTAATGATGIVGSGKTFAMSPSD